jgi:type VII secretion protein EccB
MAGQSTKLQISGQRFMMRRTAHALVRADVSLVDDPPRAQSLSMIAGCLLTVVVVAVCAVLAFLRPSGRLGDSPIVMVRETGAMYVRVGDTVHPALNLASARLVTGSSASPRLVSGSAVDDAVRGAMLGIPGAPDSLANPLTSEESGWTVCEDATSTTVIAGQRSMPSETRRNVLVVARGESAASTYLLFDGNRAKVDLRNPVVVRALDLEGITPRRVSRALLDSLPEVAEISTVRVPDAGTAGPARLHGFPVGTVIRVPGADTSQLFVVLADGVQRIGTVAADLIRFTQSHGMREIADVEPEAVGAVPVVARLPVGGYPDRGGVSDDPVVCAHWQWSHESGSASSAVFTAGASPEDGAVALTQADADGPHIDAFGMPGGRSGYVRATGVSGDGADHGPLYFVNDAGVVFGIRDEVAAKRLGLAAAVPAPWPVLARLPRGPELSVAAASAVRDTISTP